MIFAAVVNSAPSRSLRSLAVAALADDRHRGRSPCRSCARPRSAVRHGHRRPPPRSVHGDAAVRRARLPSACIRSRSPTSPARCSRASPARWPPTTGWSCSAFRCRPRPRICSRVISRSPPPAPPSPRWRTPSRRSISRRPPTTRTSRRRSGCRCTCWRCGDASTTRRRGALAFLGAAAAAVTLSNFYGGLIAAVDHAGRGRRLLARPAGRDRRAV